MSRNSEYEQRQKSKGFKKVTVWLPADRESDIKHAASMMCANDNLTVGVLKDIRTGRAVSMRSN
ncbi:hypothetical protein MCT03_00195 [Vibrio aestuarianus]|uniref:hypothetical protein n=1 Tax=Vibrio aestuarianus TaxID=28171 RepID=UPI00237C8B3E|nr:hypothetical protein [Vibrio aestuarianus]MDE1222802.1 hypothetical protein [Vibrio aestuarianus]MDE1328593.1 hypothetical protein [Vibrio aestuarianus]